MCARPTRRSRSGRRRRPRAICASTASSTPASETGAEAVHPGYGFLSERPAFAEALAKAGIAFIGPTPEAIAAMGDKIESKKLAAAAGVSTVPGYLDVIADAGEAATDRARHRLSGDDQGLGRRRRQGHAHRPRRRRTARGVFAARSTRPSRALATTASSSRNTSRSRATSKSRCWATRTAMSCISASANARSSAATRRSSRKRRARSSIAATRAAMGAQAVALAKAVDYRSAGTVEFIVDRNANFYFLEMNTRLQVEHPVTELVTGLDLVELMIRVAAGEKLPFAPGGRDADRLGDRGAGLCRGPAAQFPAVDRPADALSAAGGRRRPRRQRRLAKAPRSRCITTR